MFRLQVSEIQNQCSRLLHHFMSYQQNVVALDYSTIYVLTERSSTTWANKTPSTLKKLCYLHVPITFNSCKI